MVILEKIEKKSTEKKKLHQQHGVQRILNKLVIRGSTSGFLLFRYISGVV